MFIWVIIHVMGVSRFGKACYVTVVPPHQAFIHCTEIMHHLCAMFSKAFNYVKHFLSLYLILCFYVFVSSDSVMNDS